MKINPIFKDLASEKIQRKPSQELISKMNEVDDFVNKLYRKRQIDPYADSDISNDI